jgi:hypothetical protein
VHKTIIYYTHNKEFQSFEQKIQETILYESKGLPIISVSQKPINFGQNICVGEQGTNSLNTWRQVLIGCEAAKTEFVCLAESDSLHHSSYYSFLPEKDDIFYVTEPFYIIFTQKGKTHRYYKKPISDNNLIIGRECLIDSLKILLKNLPEWQKESDYEKNAFPDGGSLRGNKVRTLVSQKIGTVTFKTDQNMHRKSSFHRRGFNNVPYWGYYMDLYKRYF